MLLNRQICKCGNHEIDDKSFVSNNLEQTVADVLSNEKIFVKDYRFNIHYLVARDEWHFRQFEKPKDAAIFCRLLEINQKFKIYHQVSADICGKNETVARPISLRACEQMVGDNFAFQQNNFQTAYKLALKISSSTRGTMRVERIKNKAEI